LSNNDKLIHVSNKNSLSFKREKERYHYFVAGTRWYYATVRINRGSASFHVMWACGMWW